MVVKLPKHNTHKLADMARREVSVLEKLAHPNIIRVRGVVSETMNEGQLSEFDTCYPIMEYAENGTLIDFLFQSGPLSEALSRTLFKQMLAAIRVMHDQKICHLDLKPDNITLDGDFNIKIIDFDTSME